MIHLLKTFPVKGKCTIQFMNPILTKMNNYRLFSRKRSNTEWYKELKDDSQYQDLQEIYKDSLVHWKQPYELPNSITDRLTNLLPAKTSHKRQIDWENYLHILRRLEKENEFKDWDDEVPFTHESKQYIHDYLKLYSEKNCYAYTQYKYASTYSVTCRLVNEILNRIPNFKPINILNFGCGPNAEITAVNEILPKMNKHYTCIDLNTTMIDISRTIHTDSDIQYYQSIIQMVKDNHVKFDFIMCNNVLSEICSDKEKASLSILLYEFLAPGGVLCISERGNRYGFHTVRNARKLLLSLYNHPSETESETNNKIDSNSSAHTQPLLTLSSSDASSLSIVGPCTHCLECPLKGNKQRWCYFKQQSCSMPNKASQSSLILSEPFSYVTFYKPLPQESHISSVQSSSSLHTYPYFYKDQANRILWDPIKSDKHVIVDICTPNGTYERRTYTKGKMNDLRERYKHLRKAEFGGLLYDVSDEEQLLLHHINTLRGKQEVSENKDNDKKQLNSDSKTQ